MHWYCQYGHMDIIRVTKYYISHSLHLPSASNTQAASVMQY